MGLAILLLERGRAEFTSPHHFLACSEMLFVLRGRFNDFAAVYNTLRDTVVL